MGVKLPSVPGWVPWVAAGVGLLLVTNKASGGKVASGIGSAVGETVGETVGGAVGSVPGGLVYGIGDAIGVPRTNEDACRAAMAAGSVWDASFACPLPTFTKWIAQGKPADGPK